MLVLTFAVFVYAVVHPWNASMALSWNAGLSSDIHTRLQDWFTEKLRFSNSRPSLPLSTAPSYLKGLSVVNTLTISPSIEEQTRLGRLGRAAEMTCGPEVVLLDRSDLEESRKDCTDWGFTGTRGQIGILLENPSRLHGITIEVRNEESFPSCAPRDMTLWGLLGQRTDLSTVQRHKESLERMFSAMPGPAPIPEHEDHQVLLPIGVFRFFAYTDNLTQSFPTHNSRNEGEDRLWLWREPGNNGIDFGVVVLQIHSNWGASTTCLHRLYLQGSV